MTDLESARLLINEADIEMAHWFEKRMDAVRLVAEYKRQHGLPVEDAEREAQMCADAVLRIENKEYRPYYTDFLRLSMAVSKSYQRHLMEMDSSRIEVPSVWGNYDILFSRGALTHIEDLLPLDRKVLIVTDSGVPCEYSEAVAKKCTQAVMHTIPQGEDSKSLSVYQEILFAMVEHQFTRSDCVVAVGGGVVGDLAGFAAATYMRGVDFYNIPTTILSQVDASIGGKTAVDHMGYKNLIGAFYPPRRVVIDPDTLHTLEPRQIANGLAESVKMALTHDGGLFSLLENTDLSDQEMEEIILRSLRIKRQIVAADERESGLRRVLNFGHTLGHAIECLGEYLHGECVALGMIPLCSNAVRERLLSVLKRLGLPTECTIDFDRATEALRHDKKADSQAVTVVTVPEIGSFECKTMTYEELELKLREVTTE